MNCERKVNYLQRQDNGRQCVCGTGGQRERETDSEREHIVCLVSYTAWGHTFTRILSIPTLPVGVTPNLRPHTAAHLTGKVLSPAPQRHSVSPVQPVNRQVVDFLPGVCIVSLSLAGWQSIKHFGICGRGRWRERVRPKVRLCCCCRRCICCCQTGFSSTHNFKWRNGESGSRCFCCL